MADYPTPYLDADVHVVDALQAGHELVSLFCTELGGDARYAGPVQRAWHLLYSAIATIDGYIDGERQLQGSGSAVRENRILLNDSVEQLLESSEVLTELYDAGAPAGMARSVSRMFHQFARQICQGQKLDISHAEADLDSVWEIIATKSGSCYAVATWCGARLATDDAATLDLCQEIGSCMGIMRQIGDDYADLWPTGDQPSDIALGSMSSAPIAFALTMLAPAEAEQLRTHITHAATDAVAEAKARQMILESGAALYVAVSSFSIAAQARDAIGRLKGTELLNQKLLTIIERLLLHPNPL